MDYGLRDGMDYGLKDDESSYQSGHNKNQDGYKSHPISHKGNRGVINKGVISKGVINKNHEKSRNNVHKSERGNGLKVKITDSDYESEEDESFLPTETFFYYPGSSMTPIHRHRMGKQSRTNGNEEKRRIHSDDEGTEDGEEIDHFYDRHSYRDAIQGHEDTEREDTEREDTEHKDTGHKDTEREDTERSQ